MLSRGGALSGVFGSSKAEDHAPIVMVANTAITVKEKKIDSVINDHWHSDLSYTPRPTTATFLNAQQLPDVGGDTMFANQYMAYETLSPRLQALIEPLEALHDVAAGTAFAQVSPETQAEFKRRNPPIAHPLVRVHPETGRKSLFVGRTRSIVGMTDEESKPLLDFLNRHATRYEFIYRHRWSLNDLLMWDNRCALHYAIRDYDMKQVRLMQRCSLLGDKVGHPVGNGSHDAAVASREKVNA